MRILVCGANGQLGSCLKEHAPLEHQITYTDLAELDLTDPEAIRSELAKGYEAVINASAYTAVDLAEDEPEKAALVNETAVDYLAQACKEQGVLLVHVSTDYVFDGCGHRPYKEEDPVDPIGVYGKTKLAGERRIQESGVDAFVLRTSWLYSTHGNNFVKTMLRLFAERDELNVIGDQVGSPTLADDLALAIYQLLAGERPKGAVIYHYSNQGVASWYDFAQAILEMSGLDCRLNSIETDQYPTKATRPHYSVMSKRKLVEERGLEIPHWREALSGCLASLVKGSSKS